MIPDETYETRMGRLRARKRVARVARGAVVVVAVIVLAAVLLRITIGGDPRKLGYNLVFNQEFEETSLDTSTWNTVMRWGPDTTGELQHYDSSALQITDGKLVITARKESSGSRDYSSGTITTFETFDFTYGYAEIRAKVPAGQGLWPAFWLTAVDKNIGSEIDVLEVLGHEPDTLYMSLHWDNAQGEDQDKTLSYSGPDLSAGFHTFAVEWNASSVIWYVDGVERARQTTGVPNTPMYLIANLAIGGEWGGPPSAETQFPARYEIDYIRVYQRN